MKWLVTLAAVLAVSSAHASVLFDDTFNSFSLGTTWYVPTYLDASNSDGNSFVGAPNVALAATTNGLQMTSSLSHFQETGIATTQLFSITHGSVSVEFQTGAETDPNLSLPAGTTNQNIDGLIVLELVNPVTGKFLAAGPFGGFYGADRYFRIDSSVAPEIDSSSPFMPGATDWSYGEDYKLVLTSSGNETEFDFETGTGVTLFAAGLPQGFGSLGSFDVVLTQNIGTPTTPYYENVFVKQVEVSSAPEPATWALALVGFFGVGAMARFARRGAGKTVLA
jgi:hypothetical protein